METELTDSGAKYALFSDLRVEIAEDYFHVVGRAAIIHVLKARVEGVLDSIVLFLRWGVARKLGLCGRILP